MLKDITKESVLAFTKLIKNYEAITREDIENSATPYEHGFNANNILSILVGFGPTCSLCKAVNVILNDRITCVHCKLCIYSMHDVNEAEKQEIHCVDDRYGNAVWIKAIRASADVEELLTALKGKVHYMKKLLFKYKQAHHTLKISK